MLLFFVFDFADVAKSLNLFPFLSVVIYSTSLTVLIIFFSLVFDSFFSFSNFFALSSNFFSSSSNFFPL